MKRARKRFALMHKDCNNCCKAFCSRQRSFLSFVCDGLSGSRQLALQQIKIILAQNPKSKTETSFIVNKFEDGFCRSNKIHHIMYRCSYKSHQHTNKLTSVVRTIHSEDPTAQGKSSTFLLQLKTVKGHIMPTVINASKGS